MRTILSAAALAFSITGANAQNFDVIAGKWNNNDTGENVVITDDPLGGWQFWSSDYGQARISSASARGANIRVEGRGIDCLYHATITGRGETMNWQLRGGDSACLARVFTRAW